MDDENKGLGNCNNLFGVFFFFGGGGGVIQNCVVFVFRFRIGKHFILNSADVRYYMHMCTFFHQTRR